MHDRLLADARDAGVARYADGDAANGEKIFKRCAACHVLDDKTNRVGPHLGGVIGRTAGTVEGFKYSDAMIEKGKEGLVWNADTLNSYLEDPKALRAKEQDGLPGLEEARGARRRYRLFGDRVAQVT